MKTHRWLMSLALCIAVCFVSIARAADEDKKKKKDGLSIAITVVLDNPDSVVEIEDTKGKIEKFKGDESAKIEKALGKEPDHYVSDFVIKDAKLVKITFKRRPAEKPKKP